MALTASTTERALRDIEQALEIIAHHVRRGLDSDAQMEIDVALSEVRVSISDLRQP